MQVPQLLNNKYALYGGIGAAVIGVYYFLTRSSNTDSGYVTPIASTPYDASLVALGTEAELKKLQMQNDYASQQLDAQTGITMLGMQQASDKELLNDAAYRMTLQTDLEGKLLYSQTQLEQSFVSTALEKQADIAIQQIASDERKFGADLATQNAWKSAEYADKAAERQQYYNLQNYQTMVQHDLGKKGIKADFNSGIFNTLTAGVLKYFGK